MTDITLFDIEMAPALLAAYGPLYEPKVVWVERDQYMTCFAYKQYGKAGVICKSLRDYPLYKKDPYNDRELAKDLHKIMSESVILCAYNGINFDIRVANGIFAKHKLPPIGEHIVIDPYREGKKVFNYISHKMEYMAKMAGIPGKEEHAGIMEKVVKYGDKKSWQLHEKYCIGDVKVLDGVYGWMRPYMKKHPNMNILAKTQAKCPVCLSSRWIKEGPKPRNGGIYQKYHCKDCGKPFYGTQNLVENKPLVK